MRPFLLVRNHFSVYTGPTSSLGYVLWTLTSIKMHQMESPACGAFVFSGCAFVLLLANTCRRYAVTQYSRIVTSIARWH